jgi:uncharacterized protein (UPF0297 family)
VPFKDINHSPFKTQGDEIYEFINYTLGLLIQGGPRLVMNKKAFRKMIERYPKRHLLKDYTEEDLMFMI